MVQLAGIEYITQATNNAWLRVCEGSIEVEDEGW
jgi:hypothetical protein